MEWVTRGLVEKETVLKGVEMVLEGVETVEVEAGCGRQCIQRTHSSYIWPPNYRLLGCHNGFRKLGQLAVQGESIGRKYCNQAIRISCSMRSKFQHRMTNRLIGAYVCTRTHGTARMLRVKERRGCRR